MNRIIEIDRKNKIAVVEPYVSQAALFVETMKVGLRPNMIGAGPSASVLAGTAAHFGSGPTNISTDFGGRNLLGIEWVLPDGDVLRLGPVGPGGTGVNADGPGPSLRGVVRGYGGANGGIGIFTKCAVSCYPGTGRPGSRPGQSAELRHGGARELRGLLRGVSRAQPALELHASAVRGNDRLRPGEAGADVRPAALDRIER
jgi:hypothetical protein